MALADVEGTFKGVSSLVASRCCASDQAAALLVGLKDVCAVDEPGGAFRKEKCDSLSRVMLAGNDRS